MKCLDQVPSWTGGCLLRSLCLSGLIAVRSSLEVVGVSELQAGEVLCSRSGVSEVAVGVSEIVIPTGKVHCSCSGAWYHVGMFTSM